MRQLTFNFIISQFLGAELAHANCCLTWNIGTNSATELSREVASYWLNRFDAEKYSAQAELIELIMVWNSDPAGSSIKQCRHWICIGYTSGISI